MVDDGEIVDAKTVAGLLLTERRAVRQRQANMALTGSDVDLELPLEVEEFLSWLATERGRSANTIAAYRRDLGGYVTWLAAPGETSHGRPGTLVDFVGERRASGAASSSSPASSPRSGCSTATSSTEGERPDDPTADVEGVRVPAGLPSRSPKPR